MGKFDFKIAIRYGLLGFMAVIVLGLIMYLFYQNIFSSFILSGLIGFLSFGITLFLGIWSGVTYRRENLQVISFAQAFIAVYTVFVLAALGNIASNLLINKVIDKEYAQKVSIIFKDKMESYLEKQNVPEEKIKEALDKINPEKFNPPLSKLAQNFAVTIVIMGVIALIAAAFIKRNSSDLISTPTLS